MKEVIKTHATINRRFESLIDKLFLLSMIIVFVVNFAFIAATLYFIATHNITTIQK